MTVSPTGLSPATIESVYGFPDPQRARRRGQYVSSSSGGAEFRRELVRLPLRPERGQLLRLGRRTALPAQHPSASPNVISVGGTTLHLDTGGNFTSGVVAR